MTYPPQQPFGPHGQQPDPYGQAGGPYGQYGQQANPYTQYGGPYQQDGNFGGFPDGTYGGFGPPQPPQPQPPQPQRPPPKRNTGLIAGVSVAVVAILAAVGITGFVAPGFLLDDTANTGSGGTSSTSEQPPSDAPGTGAATESTESPTEPTTTATDPQDPGGPDYGDAEGRELVEAFLAAINAGDESAASGMTCPDSALDATIADTVANNADLRLVDSGTFELPDFVSGQVEGTMDTYQEPADSVIGNISADASSGSWCIDLFFVL